MTQRDHARVLDLLQRTAFLRVRGAGNETEGGEKQRSFFNLHSDLLG
jgi:hypothetical protein